MFEDLKLKQDKFIEKAAGKYQSIKNSEQINIDRIQEQSNNVDKCTNMVNDLKLNIKDFRSTFHSIIKDS